MRNTWGYGLVAAVVLALLLAGCGGGDGGNNAQLERDRDAALAELEDLREAQEKEEEEESDAETQRLTTLTETITRLTTALAGDETGGETQTAANGGDGDGEDEGDGDGEGDDEEETPATTTPTTTTSRPTTTIESDRRAKKVWEALAEPYATSSLVQVRVPSKDRLTLEATGFTTGSGPTVRDGFKSARLTDSTGGIKQTLVAVTDREVSRPIHLHYSNSRLTDDAKEFVVARTGDNGVTVAALGLTADGSANISTNTFVEVTHGLRKPADPPLEGGITIDTQIDVDAVTKETFRGKVHGVTGTFHCGANCQLIVDGTYYRSDYSMTADRSKLATLTIVPTIPDAPVLFASTGTIYLGPGGVTGVIDNDDQYMTFGYWKEEPGLETAPHPVEVFAIANNPWGGGTLPTGVSATYRGPALGVYAERNASGDRHGEFTGTAILNAKFEATSTVDGRITFNGKPWLLTLSEANVADGAVSGGDVTIAGIAGAAAIDAGNSDWEATFLSNHDNSRVLYPLSAVGRFKVTVTDVLRLSGAFGVHHPGGIAE